MPQTSKAQIRSGVQLQMKALTTETEPESENPKCLSENEIDWEELPPALSLRPEEGPEAD